MPVELHHLHDGSLVLNILQRCRRFKAQCESISLACYQESVNLVRLNPYSTCSEPDLLQIRSMAKVRAQSPVRGKALTRVGISMTWQKPKRHSAPITHSQYTAAQFPAHCLADLTQVLAYPHRSGMSRLEYACSHHILYYRGLNN